MDYPKDELLWFPMRVTYHREMQVKACLDSLHVENFLPMKRDLILAEGGWKETLVPAIQNLLFVRSDQVTLTELKHSVRELEPLRYMTWRPLESESHTILHVPDRQMENFMKPASVQDDSVKFLENGSYLDCAGRSVVITAGPFEGVEGVIKRIHKNKYVVVQIKHVAALAINSVPSAFLRYLE